MIQIAIIDDHPLLIEGLKTLINNSGVANTMCTAVTAKKGLQLLRFNKPDVLLLDIILPDANGIELCKIIHEQYPLLNILALTSFGEYTIVRKMMESGAKGYILKNAMPEEIIAGIKTVAGGKIFLCREIDLLLNKTKNKEIFLTPRESSLLKLIVEGFTNAEIAGKLFLGIETVNSYRKNLLFKLNARNTAMLVKITIEQKLV